MTLTLRPDQLLARRAIYAAWQAGHARVLQQAPTAWGKGTLAAAILADVARAGKRGVFVAHLSEINQDLVGRLRGAGVEPRLLMGDQAEGPADSLTWVVSEQTATRRSLQLTGARVVIRDEAHRAAATSHAIVSAAAPADAWHLGLTATPERGDGRPLSFYQLLLPGPSPSTLVAQGIIAPIITRHPGRPAPELAQDPVEVWPSSPSGAPLPGVLFAKNIPHSIDLAVRFNRERGIRAVHVEADTPNRDAIVERFNGGDIDVLTCYRLLVEGVDTRRSAVTMLACSMSHPGPMLQAIGRSRRMHPDKPIAYFYDLTDNFEKHGFPDDERTYHLEGRAIRRAEEGPNAPPVRCCTECLTWGRAGRACIFCGALLPPPPPPRISRRAMVERLHARQRLEGPEWEAWVEWVRTRRARGKTPQQIAGAWRYGPGDGSPPSFTVAAVPLEPE